MIENEEQFQQAVDDFARLEVEIEREVTANKARLQRLIDKHKEKLQSLKDRRTKLKAAAKKFASRKPARRALFPGERKSAESALSVYGFRFGNPKIDRLDKSITEEDVISRIKKDGCDDQYVRMLEEVNREGLLADKVSKETLERWGLKRTQSEGFFIEAKSQSKLKKEDGE